MSEPVLTVEQMRAAERAAVDAGTSEWELMQRAGRGAALWVMRAAAGRGPRRRAGPRARFSSEAAAWVSVLLVWVEAPTSRWQLAIRCTPH